MAIATLADAGLSRSADDGEIKTQVQTLVNQLKPMAEICGAPLADNGALDAFHPLRTDPFLFAQLPLVDGVPLIALQWGAIILLVGDIAQYWGPDEALQRPREVIRTAQEFGINLLMFAWQHHTLTQLQQRVTSDAAKARSTAASLTSRINPSGA